MEEDLDLSVLKIGNVSEKTTDSCSFGNGSNNGEWEFCEEPKEEWGYGYNPSNGTYKTPTDKRTHLKPLTIFYDKLIAFRPKELMLYSENFKEENLIGLTQFGKLYRGKIGHEGIVARPRYVTIKIWDEKSGCLVLWNEDYRMVQEELSFLTNRNVIHEGLPKVIGYCFEEETKSIVYDVNTIDRLDKYILRDDVTWSQRINVAHKLANVLAHLHNQSYLIFNISTRHVVLDEKHNPILLDFGLLSGGIIGEMNYAKSFVHMAPGYFDPFYAQTILKNICSDVFAYGVILLELIAKRIFDSEIPTSLDDDDDDDIEPGEWAEDECKAQRSIIHDCFLHGDDYYETDGSKIIELCLSCLNAKPGARPTMKTVARILENLAVFQSGVM